MVRKLREMAEQVPEMEWEADGSVEWVFRCEPLTSLEQSNLPKTSLFGVSPCASFAENYVEHLQ